MTEQAYTYIVAGAGLAGAAAARGIRELDKNGTVLIVGAEPHAPYHRPPLTKGLWSGKKKLQDVFVNSDQFYADAGIDVLKSTAIGRIDTENRRMTTRDGTTLRFEKLLLATGGYPRRLTIPGGDLEGILYYRYLDNYTTLRNTVAPSGTVLIVGGGFIGSELAASMAASGYHVVLLFPEKYLCARVFEKKLGAHLMQLFRERGVEMFEEDRPVAFARTGQKYTAVTSRGREINADSIVVGAGIEPETTPATTAGVAVANGVVVDTYLKTTAENIYAAGDTALFPYPILDRRIRVEHWDNALNQGAYAGRNMAGAGQPYGYIPYFFSDLFEFGYEAVGEINSELQVAADWKEEYVRGVLYYLHNSRIQGIMLVNVWNKVDAARELLRSHEPVTPSGVSGLISFT